MNLNALKALFNKANGTSARNLLRAVLLCLTAFGLKMTGDQVAAVMLVVEAALGVGTASSLGETPPPV